MSQPAKPAEQKEFVEQMLTGSQAKTAYALRKNCERLIAGHNPNRLATGPAGEKCWVADNPEFLNSTGFLTLTVGDYHCNFHGKQIPGERDFCPVCGNKMHFVQVKETDEASKRFNSLRTGFLKDFFSVAIVVTERHKSEAIHFHALGRITGAPDIRTGLDFDALAKRDYRSAPQALRDTWALLRDTLPRYGFGRAELLPVRKTSEAVAAYVSKYIEKNVCNRLKSDRRKKLVRYIGWQGSQLRPNDFSWFTPQAAAWRYKTKALAGLVGLDHDNVAMALGPRWAFSLSALWVKMDDRPVREINWTWPEREVMRAEVVRLNEKWAADWEKRRNPMAEIIFDILSYTPPEKVIYSNCHFFRVHEGGLVRIDRARPALKRACNSTEWGENRFALQDRAGQLVDEHQLCEN
jgi:hypothetical protein